MKLDNLPPQYVPLRRIRLGSNTLEDVVAVLSVNGFVPLLVGNGEPLRVWLSIPTNREGTEWYPLIKDNFSSHPDVVVEAAKKRVTVRTPQGTVLNVMKNADDAAVFAKLDLRPFGLNVYADEGALHVMGNTLSKNEFRNVKVVIGVGSTA